MEVNDLFKLGAYVYKVMPNPQDRCDHCAAFLNKRLCFKMPDCGLHPELHIRVYFKRLNKRELRQANKQNINIQNL